MEKELGNCLEGEIHRYLDQLLPKLVEQNFYTKRLFKGHMVKRNSWEDLKRKDTKLITNITRQFNVKTKSVIGFFLSKPPIRLLSDDIAIG